MAGEPTEAMIGIGALGLGVVLVFAAYKNVSPVALIRNAVTTGDLDYSKLPKIVEGSGGSSGPALPDIEAVLVKVDKADPTFGSNLRAALSAVPVGPIKPGDDGYSANHAKVMKAREMCEEAYKKKYITLGERDSLDKWVDAKVKQ